MNFNSKLYTKFLTGLVVIYLCNGCAKFENRTFSTDEPQSLINQAELDSLKDIKTYLNPANESGFKFGAELSVADLASNSVLYRLVKQHFKEIAISYGFNPTDYMQSDGSIVLDNFQKAIDQNKTANMDLYLGNLVWHEKQQSSYLNSLIADIILPGEKGTDLIVDFEKDKIGDTYPTDNPGATATVVADPEGKSGNVLRVLKSTGTAFPQFKITLPEGRTLGQCINLTLDFRAGGSFGLYGAGMRLGISTTLGSVTLTNYGSPSSFGNGDNVWGRGLIILPIATLNLTATQKQLNSFVVTLGSQTGSADYLIDNIKMDWEIKGETIIKSPEEKKNILTAELEKWLKAIGETGKDAVKSWSVIYQPMDETYPSQLRTGKNTAELPANIFYWQDYLGKDYAATAINILKKYVNNTDKIFFTETNLMDNTNKIQGLADFISYTEQKGAKVDGIATELALNINADKSKIETMLKKLAATGKLIKISALDIGTGVKTSESSSSLYEQQAEMYQWFLESYFKLIPLQQQAGITLRSPADQNSTSSWRPNEPVGIWASSGGYIRKLAYRGIVDALMTQNK